MENVLSHTQINMHTVHHKSGFECFGFVTNKYKFVAFSLFVIWNEFWEYLKVAAI